MKINYGFNNEKELLKKLEKEISQLTDIIKQIDQSFKDGSSSQSHYTMQDRNDIQEKLNRTVEKYKELRSTYDKRTLPFKGKKTDNIELLNLVGLSSSDKDNKEDTEEVKINEPVD